MFIRHAFIASLLAICGSASTACAQVNSCSNVGIIGFGYRELVGEPKQGIAADGTFRIEGEPDENKQPWFSLTNVACDKQPDNTAIARIKCTVTSAFLMNLAGPPNTDIPNCTLDMEINRFSMDEA